MKLVTLRSSFGLIYMHIFQYLFPKDVQFQHNSVISSEFS